MGASSLWIALGSALGGALGATLGWTVSSFVGAPLRKFFDIRGEIIRRLTEFANVRARWKEVLDESGAFVGQLEAVGEHSAEEIARLEEAQRVIRDLGSQMRAFAENETAAMWCVRLRYDPARASAGLIGLSNTYHTYGQEKHSNVQTVNKALRINI
jgi:hypothetical protein